MSLERARRICCCLRRRRVATESEQFGKTSAEAHGTEEARPKAEKERAPAAGATTEAVVEAHEHHALVFSIHLVDHELHSFHEAKRSEFCEHVKGNLACDHVEVVDLKAGSVIVHMHAVGFADADHVHEAGQKISKGDAVHSSHWGNHRVDRHPERFIKLHNADLQKWRSTDDEQKHCTIASPSKQLRTCGINATAKSDSVEDGQDDATEDNSLESNRSSFVWTEDVGLGGFTSTEVASHDNAQQVRTCNLSPSPDVHRSGHTEYLETADAAHIDLEVGRTLHQAASPETITTENPQSLDTCKNMDDRSLFGSIPAGATIGNCFDDTAFSVPTNRFVNAHFDQSHKVRGTQLDGRSSVEVLEATTGSFLYSCNQLDEIDEPHAYFWQGNATGTGNVEDFEERPSVRQVSEPRRAQVLGYRCPACNSLVDSFEEAIAHCAAHGPPRTFCPTVRPPINPTAGSCPPTCGYEPPSFGAIPPSQAEWSHTHGWSEKDRFASNRSDDEGTPRRGDGDPEQWQTPTITRILDPATGRGHTVVKGSDGSESVFGEQTVTSLLRATAEDSQLWIATLRHEQLQGLVHEVGQQLLARSSTYTAHKAKQEHLDTNANKEFFGLDENSTEKDLDYAYRNLARRLHPDKNGGTEDAKRQFQDLQERYEGLKSQGQTKDSGSSTPEGAAIVYDPGNRNSLEGTLWTMLEHLRTLEHQPKPGS